MRRSFRENVVKEIYRRESVRCDRRLELLYKKREEEEMMFEKNADKSPEEVVMDVFKLELKRAYETLSDCEGFELEAAFMPSNFSKVAKKVGFIVSYEEEYCKFTVPAFKKGNRRTPAQLMLYKYQRELSKKRKERKAQLLAECKRVKQAIADGKFRDTDATETFREIYVKSRERVTAGYEEKVVCNFFAKLKLNFKCSRVGVKDEWMFSL